MAIEVQDMSVFLAVVREGSFGRAATTLLVSQPSVSERIVRLERLVGVRLFDRTNRGAALTAAGRRLLPYAQRTVALVQEAATAARSAEQPPEIRVTVHSTFSHRAIPLVLDALAGLPRVLKFRDAHSDEIVAMLLDGVTDIGFVLPATPARGLRYLALPADPVICVCAPTHALAAKRAVRLDALADHFVALNVWGTDAEKFVEELERAGVPEWHRRECSDANTAIRLARGIDHVAFVTASAAADDLASGTLIRLNVQPAPRWTVPLAIAYHERNRADPAITALRAAARQISKAPTRAPRPGTSTTSRLTR
jgi:DNA-binding transcriptional LysR family regulator